MYRMRRQCTTMEAGCRRVRICKGPRDPLQLQGVLQREVHRRRRVHQGVARRRPPGLRSSATAPYKRHDVVVVTFGVKGETKGTDPDNDIFIFAEITDRHIRFGDQFVRIIVGKRARWNNPVTS